MLVRIMAALLAVVVVACTATSDDETPQADTGDGGSARATTGADAELAAVPVLGGTGGGAWRALPEPPMAGRGSATVLWTGAEVLVWGGFGDELDPEYGLSARDGGRYDPVAETWTTIPPAPIGLDYQQVAVWSGEDLLVWANQGGSDDPVGTAAYTPATEAWRDLPWAPVPRMEGTGGVWTGDELLVWGSDNGLGAFSAGPTGAQVLDESYGMEGLPEGYGDVHLAAYDPDADAWRTVPAPPLAQPRLGFGTVWTGDRLVLWGGGRAMHYRPLPGCDPVCNDALPEGYRDAAALDPATGTWERLPDVPAPVAAGFRTLAWTGEELLGFTAAPEQARPRLQAWDPFTGAVRPLADLPGTPDLAEALWTGRELLALQTKGAAPGDGAPVLVWSYDPAEDAWSTLPAPPVEATRDLAMVWAGDELVLYGGTRWPDDFSGGIAPTVGGALAFDPEAPAPPPPAPSPDFAVEVAVEVDGELPVRIAAREAEGLVLGGTAETMLTVTAERDVLLLPPVDWTGPGVLEQGPGLLVVLGERGSYHQGLAQEGLCVPSADLVPTGLLDARRALQHPLTVLAQEPPFAPVPGTYVAEVPLRWWEALAPPQPYDPEPDGEAVVRIRVTLTAVSAAAEEDRSGQPEARVALTRPPCGPDVRTLATGDVDREPGTLAVEVDGLGWFGIASTAPGPRATGCPTTAGSRRRSSSRSCTSTAGRCGSASTRRAPSTPPCSRRRRTPPGSTARSSWTGSTWR